MKAITVRLPESDLKLIRQVKDAGFSSIGEVIKCAALSLAKADTKSKKQPA